jgi:uracil-DNA glycosylase
VPLIVTYHPAALLRNPAWKRPTWEDVQLARRILDRARPSGA